MWYYITLHWRRELTFCLCLESVIPAVPENEWWDSSFHLLGILFIVYWILLLYHFLIHRIISFHLFRIETSWYYRIGIVSAYRTLFNICNAVSANVSNTKVSLVIDCLCWINYNFFTHCYLPENESLVLTCTLSAHLFLFLQVDLNCMGDDHSFMWHIHFWPEHFLCHYAGLS